MMKEDEDIQPGISEPLYGKENIDPNVARVRIGTTRPETDDELAARRAKQGALRNDFDNGLLGEKKKKPWYKLWGGKRRTKSLFKKKRTKSLFKKKRTKRHKRHKRIRRRRTRRRK